MLYLIRPHEPLVWNDLPGSLVQTVTDNGADLAKLDWEPTTDTRIDDLVISLALRHGVKASTGIAFDGGIMSVRVRPSQLMHAHRAANNAQAELTASQGPLLEHLMPGWTNSTNALNQRVDESANRELQRAVNELAKELEAPISPDLQQHWLSLGGRIPTEP